MSRLLFLLLRRWERKDRHIKTFKCEVTVNFKMTEKRETFDTHDWLQRQLYKKSLKSNFVKLDDDDIAKWNYHSAWPNSLFRLWFPFGCPGLWSLTVRIILRKNRSLNCLLSLWGEVDSKALTREHCSWQPRKGILWTRVIRDEIHGIVCLWFSWA